MKLIHLLIVIMVVSLAGNAFLGWRTFDLGSQIADLEEQCEDLEDELDDLKGPPPRKSSRLSSRDRARAAATRANIQSISTAIMMYELEYGKMPDSLQALTVESTKRPAVLEKLAPDSWGNDFRYTKKGHGMFEIRSAGPDGRMMTEDDITN